MKHVYRTCALCDAHCGLDVTVDEATHRVLGIRGDDADPFSAGYVCPKSQGAKGLHEDPDRLRAPLVRRNGALVETDWKEALDCAAAGLSRVRDQFGADRVALYAGNPVIHDMGTLLSMPVLLRSLGTRSFFTAASVDTLPKNLACALLFGRTGAVPVPDVDRTDHLLVFGANPLVSNGSVMMAADLPGRLRRLRERGGRLVVVDPRRNETAAKADAHHFIRPGTDAFVLLAMIHTLFEEGHVALGTLAPRVNGLERLRVLASEFAPEKVAPTAGMEAGTVRQLARDLALSPCAICYGRIGTCTQRFGTLASFAIDVLNVLAGNLDRPGGVMFPRPAASLVDLAEDGEAALPFGRFHTQVRGLPEFEGQLPLAALAEEIDAAPAPIRALVVLAGNPALSAPNGPRLARALERLEFVVSLDYYLNETSRFADVILPPSSPLTRSNCDLYSYPIAVRNVVHHSPAALAPEAGLQDPWTTAFELSARLQDMAAGTLEEAVIGGIAARLSFEELDAAGRSGPDRVLDLLLRAGPYALRLAELDPHGVDLGALEPGLDRVLAAGSGRIELVPEPIERELDRLGRALAEEPRELLLVGRRQVRSNNSWMHNLPALAKGKARCTLLVNPRDAELRGLASGSQAELRSEAGCVTVPVVVSDEVMPGVVSLPHGFGHDAPGMRLQVATMQQRGVSANAITSEEQIDELSGTAVLNGVPVELSAAR